MVSDTPELQRVAQNTRLQSQVCVQCFFTTVYLSKKNHHIASYNTILHCIEMYRCFIMKFFIKKILTLQWSREAFVSQPKGWLKTHYRSLVGSKPTRLDALTLPLQHRCSIFCSGPSSSFKRIIFHKVSLVIYVCCSNRLAYFSSPHIPSLSTIPTALKT